MLLTMFALIFYPIDLYLYFSKCSDLDSHIPGPKLWLKSFLLTRDKSLFVLFQQKLRMERDQTKVSNQARSIELKGKVVDPDQFGVFFPDPEIRIR